ncbi:Flavin carrier protein 2 [Ceratocystis platani]|uniref:Flavin carrier protein 2 n=1 Tax=Ceratocystis fimbriata f. sp. platani TaxID=88771 RepID=A0A0F8B5C1_CERFI|nr:Flavin carrier protein 2 [Ceratocystis platani]
MKFSLARWGPLAALAALVASPVPVVAERVLTSQSLNTCGDSSGFGASLFKVVFTPGNGTASIDLEATVSVNGNVTFDISISAYGYEIIERTIDPCDYEDLAGICPLRSGHLTIPTFSLPVDASTVKDIPGIAYSVPDLDATVRIIVSMSATGDQVACVEADISNGKTVNLLAVKWATAVVAGLALISAAVISGMGHSNTAAHVASNAMSLFSYFQAQAMIGLTAVRMPPIVRAWTQDFQWSMGVIHLGFMQDIFTWYQRATGGTPTTLFDSMSTVSVQVEKRGLLHGAVDLYTRGGPGALMTRDIAMLPRAAFELARRSVITTSAGHYLVYGIERVAFLAHIESSNFFLTGLTFFCLFVIATIGGIAAFKGITELLAKNKTIKPDRFQEFRNGWRTVLKGVLFRISLIGFPQLVIICMWEFKQNDSPAEVVLAVFFFFGISITLAWAASKVILIARRSVTMHQNPAYILFSDPQAINKWGFLYVQYRASAYYFIVPTLAYLLVKGMFIAFGQKSDTTQAVAFVILEAAALITASVIRPWMDKTTNSINISICAVNFINAIFLFLMTNVFSAPALMVGIVGVVLFILNAAFSLILLLMIIGSTVLVFFRKNPDNRYHYMADDRASFMKSQTHLAATTELDALAATARGDKHGGYKTQLDLDEDNESISSDSIRKRAANKASGSLTASNAASASSYSVNEKRNPPGSGSIPPRSPIDPSLPLFPGGQQRSQSPSPSFNGARVDRAPASPYGNAPSTYSNSNANVNSYSGAPSPAQFRQQNNQSPWQRGAGY